MRNRDRTPGHPAAALYAKARRDDRDAPQLT